MKLTKEYKLTKEQIKLIYGYNENEINKLMLEVVAVGERHGIRFPRAFALLLKQMLYFDRYIRILAPDMNLFDDDRIEFMALGDGKPALLH